MSDRCGLRGRWRAVWRVAWWCVFVILSGTPIASRADAPKQVLILYSNQNAVRVMAILDGSIRQALQAHLPGQANIFSEYLDLERFPDPEQTTIFEEYLRAKYANQPIDLIIALGPDSLSFLTRRRAALFSDAPVIFAGISEQTLQKMNLPLGTAGIVGKFDPEATVQLALRLQPDARHLIVVTGASAFDKAWEDKARRALHPYEGRLDIRYLAGLPMAELLQQVGRLPERSIVLYLTVFRDGAGQDFVPGEAAQKVASAANAPVYGVYDLQIGNGFVGSHFESFEAMGSSVGQLGLRVLAGEKPTAFEVAPSIDVVDWRQLQRWGLSDADLPPNSVVRFRELSLWEAYWWQIIIAATLLVVQSLLLLALLVQGARRRRAEQASRENEERVTLATSSAHLGLWQWDIERKRLWVSDICRQILGLNSQPDLAPETFFSAMGREYQVTPRSTPDHPANAGSLERVESPVIWKDGSEHWIRAIGRTALSATGRPARITGAVIDITSEKKAERESALWRQELTHFTRAATLGELSGAIAHELNQPLTAILTNADAAGLILAQKSDDLAEVREILNDIVADATRGADIIKHLRILFAKADLQTRPLVLNEVVAEALKLVHSDLVARRVVATSSFSPDLPIIQGDRVQLQQVLLNLIHNACDAMSENPPAERKLVVMTTPDDNATRFSVTDHGMGIKADKLESLFKPFVTTKSGGLGLGLSICRSIVEAHGGKLWAFNNPERGATFCVSLPVDGGARQ